MGALLVLLFSFLFWEFPSTNLIGDGLRHLPALRTIAEGPAMTFQPKPWLEVYRAHYDRAVVHNHFLFGLLMRTAFAVQQALGVRGDATIAIHAVNAVSAAISGCLFFLLALRLGVPKVISLAAAVGVCLSPVYLIAATNVAEVAPALPFFVGTLLVLASGGDAGRRFTLAGVLVGLAGITYLLAGSLLLGITVAVIVSQFDARSKIRTLSLFLSSFSLVFLGIWVVVLFVSGVHSPTSLALDILKLPGQGTYGGFKLGSLVATPIGLTEAFFPVLPDDFHGLRFLYRETPALALLAGLLSLIVWALLTRGISLLSKQGVTGNLALFSSFLTFFLVEAVCFWFDPYYSKLQTFALILFWLIVAVGVTRSPGERAIRFVFLLFVAAVAACGVRSLRANTLSSQASTNAQQLHAIVGQGVLITGWSSDVAHLWLYSNGENIVSLPDFAMARNLQPSRVEADLNAIIAKATAERTKVYFYGVFDADNADLIKVYEATFHLTGFTSYLRAFQENVRAVKRFEQPGRHWNVLYLYSP